MYWSSLDIRRMTRDDYDAWYAAADAERRQKTDARRRAADRLCSIAGDHLAREALARQCGVDPARIRFGRTPAGKPYAIGLDVHFSISHSAALVVCAVSDRPIGIDVERIRPVRAKLAGKVCTPAELAYIRQAAGWGEELTGQAMERFFRIWTAKEAWFKQTGTGITDLKSIDTLAHIRGGGTFRMDDYMVCIWQA